MFTSDFSVSDLEQRLRPMYLLWHSAFDGGAFPSLASLGLPNAEFAPDILSVYEIERSRTGAVVDFKALYARCRASNTLNDKFVGTRLSEHQGFGPGSMVWGSFAALAATPEPLLASLPYVGPLPEFRSTSEVYLPLLGDSGHVDYILVGVVLLQREYRP